jgi:beta,beta-carotene 9',10'-dioxygenase
VRSALHDLVSVGFADDLSEHSEVVLRATGKIPDWLNGHLIRNGPALFRAGERLLEHWFDGFAKLHKFSFLNGRITYSSKFLQSQAYTGACNTGNLQKYEFATSPVLNKFERLKAIFNPPLTDNANVNVINMGKTWLAMTETASLIRFDPKTLDTIGKFKFEDRIAAQITTAHPLRDPNTGDVFNFHIHLSASHHYLFSRQSPGSNSRKIICKIPVKQPGYTHSFAQTTRYLIFIEQPLLLDPMELILGKAPYINCYHWQKDRGLRIYLIDKSTGTHTVQDFNDRFFFHTINAFEDGLGIKMDVLTYPDAAVINALRLENVAKGGPVPIAQIERFEIDPDAKTIQAHRMNISRLELPEFNHQLNCADYKIVYGAGATNEKTFLDHVIKVDLKANASKRYIRANCFYGEPIFVARPRATVEDDGVLLVIELDPLNKQASIVVIDAKSMEELGRAGLPNLVPFGFHGQFTLPGE